MKGTLNTHRLNNLLRGIQTSISLFESQGHSDVYFTAQFFREGKKQNGIARGDLQGFSKQIRTYIKSEDADAARIEFLNERTGKSIYSKIIDDLRLNHSLGGTNATEQSAVATNPFSGFGDAQISELIDRKVDEHRRNDELVRRQNVMQQQEQRIAELTQKNQELESQVKAKSDLEFYTGMLGTALPGIAKLFTGSPLEKAANLLAGTEDEDEPTSNNNNMRQRNENATLADLVNEFCTTLNRQELAAIELIFRGFEADRDWIQTTVKMISFKSSPNEVNV